MEHLPPGCILIPNQNLLPLTYQDQYGRATRFSRGPFYYFGSCLYCLISTDWDVSIFRTCTLHLGRWVRQQETLLKPMYYGCDRPTASNQVKSVILNLTKIVLELHEWRLVTPRDWDINQDIFMVGDQPVLTVEVIGLNVGDVNQMEEFFNFDFRRLAVVIRQIFDIANIAVPVDLIHFIDLLEDPVYRGKKEFLPIHGALLTSRQRIDLIIKCHVDIWLQPNCTLIVDALRDEIDLHFPLWYRRIPIGSRFESVLYHPHWAPEASIPWGRREQSIIGIARDGSGLPHFVSDLRAHLDRFSRDMVNETRRLGYGERRIEYFDDHISTWFPGLVPVLQRVLRRFGLTLLQQ